MARARSMRFQPERCPHCQRGALYSDEDGHGQRVTVCLNCGYDREEGVATERSGAARGVELPPEWLTVWRAERERMVVAAGMYQAGVAIATVAATLQVSERTAWRAVERLGAGKGPYRRRLEKA